MQMSIKRAITVLACAVAWVACRGEPTGTVPPVWSSSAGAAASRGHSGLAADWDDDHHEGHAHAEAHGPQDTEHAHSQLVLCQRREFASASAIIGPQGGTLQVGSDQLVIPPGALAHDVFISAVVPADTIASIHFEPEGLHFQRPAGLILGGEGCAIPESATPDVVYLDGEGHVLENIEAAYQPALKRVAAPIQHFSRYAIAL